MIELRVKVSGGMLVPLQAVDREAIADADGSEFRACLTQNKGRSMSQLALFWVLCGFIADNLDADPPVTKDMVAMVLKIETGHCDVVRFSDGTYRQQPRSVAFNKMSPADFSAFLDKALTAASLKFGPALTYAARRELEKIGS